MLYNCRAMLCKRGLRPMPSCGVCPSVRSSVCLSVTFVDSVKTDKYIFEFLTIDRRLVKCEDANNNCDRAAYRTDGDASLNLCLSQPAWTAMTNRTEQNLIVYAAVKLKRT